MSHDHHHHHEVTNYNKAFAIGVILNVSFVLIEAWYGYFSHSLALLADAGHNLSDVISLLLAWGASLLASKPTTSNRTYGLRKVTILASLTSALILLFALGGITLEAIQRLLSPSEVQGKTVIIVALIGVFINTATALLFVKNQKHDLNIRGAYLHMAADAAVSLGVVLAGIVILYTDWLWLDPAISLVIVAVILVGTWHLLRESVAYTLDFVPKHIDVAGVEQFLLSENKITKLHDLHIWAISTTEVAMTVHIVVNEPMLDNDFLGYLQQKLHDEYSIEHATIQVETASSNNVCMLTDSC